MKIIKFTSVPSYWKLKPFAITNKDGEILHVEEAELIRLISEAFRVPYEIVFPEERIHGKKLSNGSWTGMLGLLSRSEVDLAVGHIGLTEERRKVFNICYPHRISDLTFMANKLEPLSDSRAIFYPFSYELWILVALSMIVMSFLLCYLFKKRRAFSDTFLIVFGSLLEKSIDFKIHTLSFRILLTTWITAVLVLSSGYKGILLSFLTLPTMVGIRDISDLSRAAVENSVKCFSYRKGSYAIQSLIDSNIDSWMPIAKCLMLNKRIGDEEFETAIGKKVYVTTRFFLDPYEREYFISKDSFFFNLAFIYYSENFCCPKYLNNLIHRFHATGLNLKYRRDENFHTQLQVSLSSLESESSDNLKRISLSYLSGAFFVLLSGWILGCITLLAEIVMNKCPKPNYRKAKISPLFLNVNRRLMKCGIAVKTQCEYYA